MAARGRFITLEGGEGAGKSTQIRLLADALRTAGIEVITTREPGGSPGAEQIRALLVNGAAARWDAMTETLLHFAARRDHCVKTIEPALDAGRWVVSDRFADSTSAYQGYGQGMSLSVIRQLYVDTLGDFAPDLTMILDVPVEVGLKRAVARGAAAPVAEDRYESMDVAFHRRLRDGFLAIAGEEPRRCVVVDANREIAEIQHDIRRAVSERLKVRLDLEVSA